MPPLNLPIRSAKELSPAQVRVLRVLLKGRGPWPKKALLDSAKCNGQANEALGPLHKDDCNEWDIRYGRRSLVSLGLVQVTVEEINGESGPAYQLTPTGRVLAGSLSVMGAPSKRVPPEVLDPILLSEKARWTYGLDQLTDDDLRRVRDRLPSEYHDLPLRPDLLKLVTGRRKAGAFKERKVGWPPWYKAYRQSEHFQQVASDALQRWGYRCTLNHEHTTAVQVYHRDYGPLGCRVGGEGPGDVIILCKRCYEGNRARLPLPPEECPY